jgi:hypothetical protein
VTTQPIATAQGIESLLRIVKQILLFLRPALKVLADKTHVNKMFKNGAVDL